MASAFATALVREVRFLIASRWDMALSTALPIFLLVAAAWLFSAGTPRDLPAVLVDQDHSAFSREAARLLDAAPGIAIAFERDDPAGAWPIIQTGEAYGVFVIPKDAEREIKAGRPASVLLYTASSYYTASATLQREAGYVASALSAKYLKKDAARANPKRVRPPPVVVQMTTLFNPNTSYEWMLVGPLQACLLVILLSCAAITSVGREFSRRTFRAWVAPGRGVFLALCGKLAPYLLVYFVYGVLSFAWLAWGRGYPVAGSLWALLAGYGLMLLAYAFLGVLIVAGTRDSSMAMGAVAVYASSAMAFSGAFFPLRGASLFAQSWNAVQPYTWFTQISMQCWQMGAPASVSAKPLAILGVMAIVTAVGAILGLRLAASDAARGTL